MNYGYDIYGHESRGQVAISRDDNFIVVATVKPDQTCTQEKKPLAQLAGLVTKLNRSGYVKMAKSMYLSLQQNDDGRVTATFTKNHPDLTGDKLGDVVLFVNKPQGMTEDTYALWDEQLDTLSPSWPYASEWLRKQSKATYCIAAFDNHPAMALLVAQWALTNNLPIASKLKGIPKIPPQQDPLSWVDCLKVIFDEQKIQACASDMGMSFRNLFEKTPKAKPASNNTESGDWLASLDQAAF